MHRHVLVALAILVPATAGAQQPRASAVRSEGTDSTVAALRSQVESLQTVNQDLGSRLAQLESVVNELRRFRERVLFAIQPELGELDERIGALEAAWADDYADHRHGYKNTPFGLATAGALANCADCLIAFVPQQNVGSSAEATTSAPE